jgi:sulfite exporter TauE/SafE
MDHSMHHGMQEVMGTDFSIWAVLLFGLATSFGHCIGMCSPIVLAYTSAKMQTTGKARQLLGHFLYALGRISSYALLGLIAALVGSVLTPTNTAKAIAFAVLGVVMILFGVSLLGGSRFLALVENGAIARSAWYKRFFSALIASRNSASFYAIGVLNGLLPCGAVYAALAMALAANDAIAAVGAMALFGVATTPSLFVIGLFVGVLSGFKFRKIVTILSAIIVVAMGIWTLYRSFNLFMA